MTPSSKALFNVVSTLSNSLLKHLIKKKKCKEDTEGRVENFSAPFQNRLPANFCSRKIFKAKGDMKVLLIFVFSLVYSISYAQEWEYAFIYEISSGMVQTKAEFTFGSKYDSVKAYGKFKHAIDALDFSSRKGWELFQIYTQRTTAEATIYLLRRRKAY